MADQFKNDADSIPASSSSIKPKLRKFSPAGKSILRKSLRTSLDKSKVKTSDASKVEESPSSLFQNNNVDSNSKEGNSILCVPDEKNLESGSVTSGHLEQILASTNSAQPSARLVIESTLRKSANILSDFTEKTISRTGTNFTSLLQAEKFGIPSTSGSGLKKNRPWCDSTPSVQCSVSMAQRKAPDMSKLPRNIAELLKEDSSIVSLSPKGSRPPQKKYHSKKMALKQQISDDTSSSRIDLPVANVKSSTSGESKAPKIVVVSGPLKLGEQTVIPKTPPPPPPENVESRTRGDRNRAHISYRRTNHLPIIQSIKEAVEKVHNNTTKFSKDNQQQVSSERGSGSSQVKKLILGVDKGVAFVLGPKTKQPYHNSFGGVKDSKWLKEAPTNCKWVINIGNFHDNEISFSMVDDNLTITGFRQPSLKYPEGQTVSESIVIPPGIEINNLRIYRSNNANELLVLEEINSLATTSPQSQTKPNSPKIKA